MRLSENERTVTGMAEYIEKWSVVNRLIDIENEFQQYKPFHGFEHAMYRKICEAEIAIGKTQAADVAPVVRCKDCPYFEPVWGDELLGRCTKAKAWYENRCIWDYCSNSSRITETAEPQPDGIQFRTVDDLGRICIPKDIRDKLGIKPGTECAVYATDELTSDEIIVIRRK